MVEHITPLVLNAQVARWSALPTDHGPPLNKGVGEQLELESSHPRLRDPGAGIGIVKVNWKEKLGSRKSTRARFPIMVLRCTDHRRRC